MSDSISGQTSNKWNLHFQWNGHCNLVI